jgi:stearoyl-CoA desaturase (delta-9 desaturase)
VDYKNKHLFLILVSVIIVATLPYFVIIPWWWFFVSYILYFLTKGIGSEVGAHRLWSHRSFTTTLLRKRVLIILNTLCGEGSIVAFVGIHRLHHAHSDTIRDPHNPHTNLLATIFYQHNTNNFNARLVKDLLHDQWLMWQHKNYFYIQFCIIILLLATVPIAAWFYSVNILVTLWTNFLVNVVCHKYGANINNLNNSSRNNKWADLFLLGVGQHNNHHNDPGNFINCKYDIWGYIIKLIQKSS